MIGSGESHGESRTGKTNKEGEQTWGEDELVKQDLVGNCLGWRTELQMIQEL